MESSVHCRHDNTARVAVPLLDVALNVAAAALAVRNGGRPEDCAGRSAPKQWKKVRFQADGLVFRHTACGKRFQ